jgi:hypothetical protein
VREWAERLREARGGDKVQRHTVTERVLGIPGCRLGPLFLSRWDMCMSSVNIRLQMHVRASLRACVLDIKKI